MAYFRSACDKGWEGLIAKRADAPYQHSRSTDWLKFKCSHRQEFVIVGFTEPEGERVGFGTLLLAYYDQSKLVYAGRVAASLMATWRQPGRPVSDKRTAHASTDR